MMTNREKLRGMGLLEMYLKNNKRPIEHLERCNELYSTLMGAFSWSRSPEGFVFWQYIYRFLSRAGL